MRAWHEGSFLALLRRRNADPGTQMPILRRDLRGSAVARSGATIRPGAPQHLRAPRPARICDAQEDPLKPYAKIDRGNHGNMAVAFKWGAEPPLYLRRLEPREVLRKAGVLSPNFWLRWALSKKFP